LFDGVRGIRSRRDTFHIANEFFEGGFAVSVDIDSSKDLVEFAALVEVDVLTEGFKASSEFESAEQLIFVFVEVDEAFFEFLELVSRDTRVGLSEEFFFEDLFLLLGQDVKGVPLALESFDGVFGVLVVVNTGSIKLVSEADEGVEVVLTLVDFVVDVFDGVKLGLDLTGKAFDVGGLALGPGVEFVGAVSKVNTESFVGGLDLGLVVKGGGTVVDLSVDMGPSLLKRCPRDFGVGGFSNTVFGDLVDEAGQ